MFYASGKRNFHHKITNPANAAPDDNVNVQAGPSPAHACPLANPPKAPPTPNARKKKPRPKWRR